MSVNTSKGDNNAVLGRILSGSQFPPHVVQRRSLRGRLPARKEGNEISYRIFTHINTHIYILR